MKRKKRRGQTGLYALTNAEVLAAEAAKKAASVAPEKQDEWKTVRTPAASAAPKEVPVKKDQTIHSSKPIFFIKGVSVKIPLLTSHPFNTAHTFLNAEGKTVEVEDHYAVLCGIPGCPGSIIQRNYIDFRESEIGENRVVMIRAWNKISKQGNRIVLLDIIKAWGTVAKFAMRFVSEEPWDIPAPHGGGIRFVPLQTKPE